MTYARVTKDNDVHRTGEVMVESTEMAEVKEQFTLDFIDTTLDGINGRIARLTAEKETWETKRAAVLTEAQKVTLRSEPQDIGRI